MFEADRGTSGNRWQLIRLRAHSEVDVTVACPRLFALTTHFVRVTVPCAGDGCALCELVGARGLLYLACLCQGRLSILELGIHSAYDLEQHAKLLHGGLRPGLVFRVKRATKKGGLHSEVLDEIPGSREVDLLTLAQRVMALYKFPCCNPGETLADYDAKCRRLALRRNELLAKQLLRGETERVEQRP